MRVDYYPGCSLHATAREFDESLRAVATALGVELREVEDWSCCGATSAHATDHRLSVGLAARNLALAGEQGASSVMAPCAACFNRLASARRALGEDPRLREELSGILGRPLSLDVQVRNVVDLLQELAPTIKERATAALREIKVACYYGCLLVRPSEVCSFDDPEMPRAMEAVVQAAGGQPVEWVAKLDCCGGGFSLPRSGSVLRLSRHILEEARKAGAELLVVACPMCHSNLDFRQNAMRRKGEAAMPVLFLTELVGLGLGLPSKALGLGRHFVDPAPLLERISILGRQQVEPALAAMPAGEMR